jgi:phage terminase large subunit
MISIAKRIFNETFFPFLNCFIPIQIFFGGSSSGKSRFLAQRCILDVHRHNRNYLITRKVRNTIKGTVWNEVKASIRQFNLEPIFDENLSELTLTHKINGKQIIFKGLDDVEKLKSIVPQEGVIDDIWNEEATELSSNDVIQLGLRTRGLSQSKYPKREIYSFNPIFKTHFLYKDYFSKFSGKCFHDSKMLILQSTYKDNKFLTPQDIARIEGLKEKDQYYYQVYALGEWGILGNVVFSNWSMADLSELKKKDQLWRNGLDFGYTNDPTGLSRSFIEGDTIYFCHEIYKRGLTNKMIANEIRPIIHSEPIICDCAEPKSIDELRIEGVNAYPAAKGKDSVNHGIQWLQQKKIVVDYSCQNMKNELSLYKWREDKDGNPINQPVDMNNHLIDPTRYAYEDVMFPTSIPGVSSV